MCTANLYRFHDGGKKKKIMMQRSDFDKHKRHFSHNAKVSAVKTFGASSFFLNKSTQAYGFISKNVGSGRL